MRRYVALLLSLLLAPAAFAQPFEAGKHYYVIEPAQPTATPDKVEVLEVFSYGCHACWSFQPKIDSWLKRMPAGASFGYLPATFSENFALFARGYYAAQALGVAERTHAGVFEQRWVKTRDVRTIEDLAKLYAELGVDEAQFLAAAKSFAIETRLKRANAVIARYGVDSTPTMIVNGKYRITGQSAGSYEKLFEIIEHLIALESGAAPAAG